MVRLAIRAEALDLHPDRSNVCRTVRVELQIHDVGGLDPCQFERATTVNEPADR